MIDSSASMAPATNRVPTDSDLQAFLEGDQQAFDKLDERYRPMVGRIARKKLGDWNAAEDASQAALMVLARRAGSIRQNKPVAGWLYGVVSLIATNIWSRKAQQRKKNEKWWKEKNSEYQRQIDKFRETETMNEVLSILYEELDRLDEKYRVPIVLIYLEGKSYEAAAHELGLPPGTVATRRAKGLRLLHSGLIRRGVTLTSAALVAALADLAKAATFPPILLGRTAQSVGTSTSWKVCELILGFWLGAFLFLFSTTHTKADESPIYSVAIEKISTRSPLDHGSGWQDGDVVGMVDPTCAHLCINGEHTLAILDRPVDASDKQVSVRRLCNGWGRIVKGELRMTKDRLPDNENRPSAP